jgi:hypothetical protein
MDKNNPIGRRFLSLEKDANPKNTPQEMSKILLDMSQWRNVLWEELSGSKLFLQTPFVMLVASYLSSVLGKRPSLDQAYSMVENICNLTKMTNPFDLFCTKKKYEKFLGSDHVAALTFVTIADRISPLVKLFSNIEKVYRAEMIPRQDALDNYAVLLQEKINLLEDQTEIITSIDFVVDKLPTRAYGEIRSIIVELEHQLGLPALFSSNYMDVNDLESQIHGPFNAIVSTYGRVA